LWHLLASGKVAEIHQSTPSAWAKAKQKAVAEAV
jgi:hypothetical protein